MSTNQEMTASQAKDLTTLLAQCALTNLTYEQAKRLLNSDTKDELVNGAQALQRRLSSAEQAEKEEPQTSVVTEIEDISSTKQETLHKDICIRFEIEGVRYKAVGYLERGVTSIMAEEVCRRATKLVVTSEVDWKRIHCNRRKLPDELLKFSYLLTNRRGNDGISILQRVSGEWRNYTRPLRENCNRRGLILCRDA